MRRALLVTASGLALVGAAIVGTSGVASSAPKPKLPIVTEVVPDHGPLGGGTTVDITGKNFGGVSGVSFGGAPAMLFTPVSQHEVQAVSPAGSGTVDVTVTTPKGTSAINEPADEFTYVTTPAIQNVTPGRGSTLGGNRVTIAGSDFTGATAVSFGPDAATSYTVESDQEIVAYTPAEPAGQVNVSVTGPDGTTPVDPADVYTFDAMVPVVTSVAPDTGPATTTVTITGKEFRYVSAVDFGSTPATSYSVDSHTKTISAVVPAGSGTVDVTVTNRSGTSAINEPADEFTYTGDD
jgi:IPT/TIG domain